ncbi:MAG: metalloregulator ArsR/SmtB family transcription factor [Candidatus Thorarchaeota archaeon]|nr:metalloregulator ArsR/SmtB family transcription factor [Candidatus Thorarchaeota archaeon]
MRQKRQTIKDDELHQMVVLFRALADRSRLKILEILDSGEELSVTEIAEKIGLERSNVSHHLSKLSDMGFVGHTRKGKQVYHFLKDECVRDIMRRARYHVTN